MGFSGGSAVKNLPARQEIVQEMQVLALIRKVSWRRAWQYSYPENAMDRGAWRATVHRVAKSQTRLKQLSMHTRTQIDSPVSSTRPHAPQGQKLYFTHFEFTDHKGVWLRRVNKDIGNKIVNKS